MEIDHQGGEKIQTQSLEKEDPVERSQGDREISL